LHLYPRAWKCDSVVMCALRAFVFVPKSKTAVQLVSVI
jgi:hypothetical protein